jgi:hypothetical protein
MRRTSSALLPLASLLLVSGVAHADASVPAQIDLEEPPPPPAAPSPDASPRHHAYLGMGFALGVDAVFHADLTIEGGVRFGQSPLLLHGLSSVGSSTDFEGSGAYYQARAGLEYQLCSAGGGACLLGGVDVGAQRWTWRKEGRADEDHLALLVVPRVGLDVGGDQLRVRAAAEAGYPGLGGLGVSLGLAWRF